MSDKPVVHGKYVEPDTDYYMQYVLALDDPRLSLDDYEIEFVEKMLTYIPERLSQKQRAFISKMAKKYLGEDIA